MITRERALEIAKKILPRVDVVEEYSDAYYFYIDDGNIYIGGNASVIVEKKTGNIIEWADYFLNDKRHIVEIGEPQRLSPEESER